MKYRDDGRGAECGATCGALFLDSGVGGIPYFRHFRERNGGAAGGDSARRSAYLADRANFPYGVRGREELCEILIALVGKIAAALRPEIIVLACNSASIAALPALRERFPALPFVGTVPAVKPAALASKTRKIGVLGTELTVRDSRIREICALPGGCEIVGIAAPELVEFVESRLESATEEERGRMARRYLDRLRASGADALVLGCTHFLFLLEDFRREALPDIAVFESVQGVSQRVESLLAASAAGRGEKAAVAPAAVLGAKSRLLLTGAAAPEPSWEAWARRLGCELSLLEGA